MKLRYGLFTVFLQLLPDSGMAQIKPNILVFSEIGQYRDLERKTPGFYHSSIPDGIKMLTKMGQEHNFSIKATSNSDDFTDGGLAAFQAVVFLNPNGYNILSPENKKAFVDFLAKGKGYVGIHAASNCEKDWPFYKDLMGSFEEGVEARQNGEVLVKDKVHISTRNLPEKFTISDEWLLYGSNIYTLDPKYSVLLSVNEGSYRSSTKTHPIAWYHEYGGGRVWYTGLGHESSSYTNPNFIEHVWGGIQYAMGSSSASLSKKFSIEPKNRRVEFFELENGRSIFMPLPGSVNILGYDIKGKLVLRELQSGLKEGWNSIPISLRNSNSAVKYLFNATEEER